MVSSVTTGGSRGTATAGSAATTSTNAGSSTISASAGNLSATNYSFTTVDGTLTINPLAVSLSGSRAYNGNTDIGGSDLVVSNVVGADTVTLSGTGTLAGANAGTQTISGFGSLALSNNNYTLTGGTGNATIDKVVLTVTADDKTRTYGSSNPSLTQTISGFVNSETTSVISGTATASTTATTSTNAGSSTISASAGNLSATNYSFTTVDGTLTINPLAVSLSGSRAYNGNTDIGSSDLVVSNVVGADTVTLSGAGTLAGANAGTQTISSFGSLALTNSNYALTGAPGSVVIQKAVLTATATVADKSYDGDDSAVVSLSLSGLVGTEDLDQTVTASFDSTDAGTRTATIDSFSLDNGTNGAASNYSLASAAITFTSNTATIAQKALTATATVAGKTYNGDDSAAVTL